MNLIMSSPPAWKKESDRSDMCYWYFGTQAAAETGMHGRFWKEWRKLRDERLLKSQMTSGCQRGSWDPIGTWGNAGGRVYTTAMAVLCMEFF
jgi:hypothetical protein